MFIALIIFTPTAITFAATYHTIIIDGTNDFSESDENMGASNFYEHYITWDSDNFYFGFDSVEIESDGDAYIY